MSSSERSERTESPSGESSDTSRRLIGRFRFDPELAVAPLRGDAAGDRPGINAAVDGDLPSAVSLLQLGRSTLDTETTVLADTPSSPVQPDMPTNNASSSQAERRSAALYEPGDTDGEAIRGVGELPGVLFEGWARCRRRALNSDALLTKPRESERCDLVRYDSGAVTRTRRAVVQALEGRYQIPETIACARWGVSSIGEARFVALSAKWFDGVGAADRPPWVDDPGTWNGPLPDYRANCEESDEGDRRSHTFLWAMLTTAKVVVNHDDFTILQRSRQRDALAPASNFITAESIVAADMLECAPPWCATPNILLGELAVPRGTVLAPLRGLYLYADLDYYWSTSENVEGVNRHRLFESMLRWEMIRSLMLGVTAHMAATGVVPVLSLRLAELVRSTPNVPDIVTPGHGVIRATIVAQRIEQAVRASAALHTTVQHRFAATATNVVAVAQLPSIDNVGLVSPMSQTDDRPEAPALPVVLPPSMATVAASSSAGAGIPAAAHGSSTPTVAASAAAASSAAPAVVATATPASNEQGRSVVPQGTPAVVPEGTAGKRRASAPGSSAMHASSGAVQPRGVVGVTGALPPRLRSARVASPERGTVERPAVGRSGGRAGDVEMPDTRAVTPRHVDSRPAVLSTADIHAARVNFRELVGAHPALHGPLLRLLTTSKEVTTMREVLDTATRWVRERDDSADVPERRLGGNERRRLREQSARQESEVANLRRRLDGTSRDLECARRELADMRRAGPPPGRGYGPDRGERSEVDSLRSANRRLESELAEATRRLHLVQGRYFDLSEEVESLRRGTKRGRD